MTSGKAEFHKHSPPAVEEAANDCVLTLFQAQAKKTPAADAIITPGDRLTYRELDKASNALGHHLRSLGIGPEALVGLCTDRSTNAIVGILGILKAGGVYVPLDPSYPTQRLAFMTEDASLSLILVDDKFSDLAALPSSQVVSLEGDWRNSVFPPLADRLDPNHLAYVIYTSGSTGVPKGVGVSHRNLIGSTRARFTYYPDPVERFLLLSSFAFDSSCAGIFWTLCQGGALLLPPSGMERDVGSLAAFIDKYRPSHVLCLPLLHALLLDRAQSNQLVSLRTVIVAGEPCPTQLVYRHFEHLPGTSLFNEYGPTEGTVWSSVYACEPQCTRGHVPIGQAIANVQIYLLDSTLQTVPDGEVGELYLGGEGLSRGYLGQPALTAERFVPCPFGSIRGERLYRTGDRGRRQPDGNIEFIGRVDNQVKLRGYRIELMEIEVALCAQPAVKESAVVIREDQPGDRRLIAYVVPDTNDISTTTTDSRQEQVSKWQTVFDEIHSHKPSSSDADFNSVGWNSATTGEPIPEIEMREWVNNTVASIQTLQPRRVLEIGCGTGLMLFQIAPQCERYWGTDISKTALDYVRGVVGKSSLLPAVVELHSRPADDFSGIEVGDFDTIVMNSVIQYFPDTDYLLRVLEGEINAVADGGTIFIGDIRSRSLLEMFHTLVKLEKADQKLSIRALRQQIKQGIDQENELIIDPEFFTVLPRHFPQISHVEVELKGGSYHNELSQFRYQVFIHVARDREIEAAPTSMDWIRDGLSLEAIDGVLQKQPDSVAIYAVPNARVIREARAVELLRELDENMTVDQLRRQLITSVSAAADPEHFRVLGKQLGYKVSVCWSTEGQAGDFDVFFRRRDQNMPRWRYPVGQSRVNKQERPIREYATNPLQQIAGKRLVPVLRDQLRQQLPEYMVPATFVVLSELPRMPNGKINREALPAPDTSRPAVRADYVAPYSGLERLLTEAWTEVLGITEIGINDNFFELGGDSLKGAMIVNRLKEELGEFVYIVALFEAPTIGELATYLTRFYADAVNLKFNQESSLSGTDTAQAEPTKTRKVNQQAVEAFRKINNVFSAAETPSSEQKNPRAIFILSAPRSGSTLFRIMLAGHPQLFSPPELNLLAFENLQDRGGDKGEEGLLLTGAIRAIMQIRGWNAEEARKFMDQCQSEGWTSKRFYRLLQDEISPQILVDKTTSYALDIDALRRAEMLFEDPLYIHLTRHPCGMIHSFESTRLDRTFPYSSMEDLAVRQMGEVVWLLCAQNIRTFLSEVPENRQYHLNFEDLVAEPEQAIAGVSAFLDIPMHPNMLDPYRDRRELMTDGIHSETASLMAGDVKFHDHKGIDPRVADKWRKHLNENELSDLTWEVAESHGYRNAQHGSVPVLKLKQEATTGSAGTAFPTIEVCPDEHHLPFPLTELQQAYWIGRTAAFELGNVATHSYREIETTDLDLGRFNRSFRRLIERHDMLRAIVLPDGEQQILAEVPPYEIAVTDLRGQDASTANDKIESIRNQMSHQIKDSVHWPLFEIRATRLDDHRILMHFSFDALTIDGWSRLLVFNELGKLYQDPDKHLKPLELSYRDYVLAMYRLRDSELYRRAKAYWHTRLDELPPAPALPLACNPSSLSHPHFRFRQARLNAQQWEEIKRRAMKLGVSASGILLNTYADVLRVWSKNPRFTINVTLFSRLPLHPEVESIIGNFTSLTMLEFGHAMEETFKQRCKSVVKQLWKDLDHQYFSGVEVLRELAARGRVRPGAAMPIVFTSLLPRDKQPQSAQLSWLGKVVHSRGQTPQVWLDNVVVEENGELVINWMSVDALFPDGMIDSMFESYQRLLASLADSETSWNDMWPATVSRIIPAQQLEQRAQANETTALQPVGLLHTPFITQAKKTPDRLAVITSTRVLSYGELLCRANVLGRQLSTAGIQPNTLVAVVMEKGWEQIVAVLGILQAGAAYVPIDAKYPKERIWQLLDDAETSLVVTQPCFDKILEWPSGIQRLCVTKQEPVDVDTTLVAPMQSLDDLAYVIYTSGSTGHPKGVMISHRGVSNTILYINQRFGVGPEDRVLALSSLSFDLSVYDIFGTLAAGAAIVVPDEADARDPAHWAEMVRDHGVSIWNSVPALLELYVEYLAGRSSTPASSLRLAMLSGDWIPLGLPERARTVLGNALQITSLGGATEVSIWSISFPVEEVDPAWSSIPYGKPLVNQGFHVLSEDLTPCPVWVPGDLYISGVGLALGYWRDEEKTSASFVSHPRTRERMYKTGDLGRYLPDGNIEFLGREDHQVKIQGFRVEQGEIETALLAHSSIRSVVVHVLGTQHEEKRLVAYIVVKEEANTGADELRAFLADRLPTYMIPAHFVFLQDLPLTSNGKVDRQALPEPKDEVEIPDPASYTKKGTENDIAQIVAEVLKRDTVGHTENWFNLGATSIDMIRILNRIEQVLSVRPSLDELYRFASVNDLTERLTLQSETQKARTADSNVVHTTDSIVSGFRLITDPDERNRFKESHVGLRKIAVDARMFALGNLDEMNIEQVARRQSTRHFTFRAFSNTALSDLLGCLRQIRINDNPKYGYASAGGLYPVRTYLYIKQDRVEKIPAGYYYYDPLSHSLMCLGHHDQLDETIYDRLVNRPIFEEAAFALFLVVKLGAIAPMYGEPSTHMVTLEAGAMTQLLEMAADSAGLGVCQIGQVNFEQIRANFQLSNDEVLIHSLLGGPVEPGDTGWTPYNEPHHADVREPEEFEEGEI